MFLNLVHSNTLQRLCFQLEEAQWYYEDFVRVQNPSFPSMKLRSFSENLFNVCPLLNIYISDVAAAINHFQSYKSVIPVRGAIILNKKMTKALMVKGWKSNSTWGFPRGKINKNEPDDLCAIREVYEEIGFDITPYLNPKDYIDVTIRQKNFKLYVVSGVPGNTMFCPQTRKEISKIEWHDVKSLPAFSSDSTVQNNTNYFMVAPFMNGLSKYIAKKRGLPSSLSKSETKALKNLLGVDKASSTVSISANEHDKDAAAAELLGLLKSASQNQETSLSQNAIAPSSEPASTQSDRNILLDLLHGKNESSQDNNLESHDLESAREILSLLKTNIDRSKEVGELNEVSQHIPQLPPPPIDPNMAPNMLPPPHPWAFINPSADFQMYPPMQGNLPPVPPGVMLPHFAPPFNGVPPFPIPGYPVAPPGVPQGFPMPPPMLPPSSEPITPLQQHASLSRQDHTNIFDLPRSPTQTPQPNSTLLALLNSRSRGKKEPKPKVKSPNATQTATSTTAAPSGSVALLSLLQQPTLASETPTAQKQEAPSSSSALLNLLRPTVPAPIESNTSSNELLTFLKGPKLSSKPVETPNLSSQPVESPKLSLQPVETTNHKNELLDLLKPAPSDPTPQTSTTSIDENANSSAFLMDLLKGTNGESDNATDSSVPQIQDSAIVNISSSQATDISQNEPSINIPDESSILLGMIRSQPSSTPEIPSTARSGPIYKPGITLHDLESQSSRRESQSPGKDLLQQLESEEKMSHSSQGNSLLSLLNKPQPTVTPLGEPAFQSLFDSSPRPSTQSHQSPPISSRSGAFGGIPLSTPPIGHPSASLSHTPVSQSSNVSGLQASGNNLFALLKQSNSPAENTPRLPSNDIQTGSQTSAESSLHPAAQPPSEQAHLDSLFSKLQVTSQPSSERYTPANVAEINATPEVQSASPAAENQGQDFRNDLLAFLHNFSNGTLPTNQ